MKGLREKKHDNFTVVRPHSALEKRAEQAGFSCLPVCPWGEWDFLTAHQLNRWMRKEKIDVLHAHSSHGLGLAAFSSLGTDIPIVATRRVDFQLSTNPFSRWKYRRAKRIIAISNGVRSVLIQGGIPSSKIDLIPSGADLTSLQKIIKASRSEMGITSEGPIVGQVAALAPHKDQRTFLLAISVLKKKLKNVQAVLVGAGELESELKTMAAELGLAESVHFLGFQQEPLRFLAAFDVFCLSSVEEGLGTSLIDAMALKIPIAATSVGGIPDLIEDEITGYLSPPKNPEILAQKIQQALLSSQKDHGFIERAANKARNFDIKFTVQKVESVYNSMI
jgi:glycosyltransferase involved in cell wall biosynthesis